jgi:hypothetical protein
MWCRMGKHGQRARRGVLAADAVVTLGLVAPAGAVWAASGAGHAAGSWGRAIEVPGLGALNKGGLAEVNEVSCVSRSFCAAVGSYATKTDSQGFLAVERNGRWGKAIEIPGLGALNKGGDAEDVSVSCGSAGNCAAGGSYEDGLQNYQGFVATERNGRWDKAIEVPGLGALNAGRAALADVTSVSCASAGNCAAGGNYQDKSERNQGFVVTERNGRWDKAIEVPALRP